jgi:hypothetical protein
LVKIQKHHYIPAGYLRLFEACQKKNHVYLYKKSETFKPILRSVKSVGYRFNYHTQTDANGNINNSLEERIGKLENEVLPFIKSLALENQCEQIILPSEKKGALAFFIGLMLTRGPGYREGIKDLHEKLYRASIAFLEQKKLLPKLPIEYTNLNDILQVNIHESVSLRAMIYTAKMISILLLEPYNYWQFNKCNPSDHFITSDTPVIFIPPMNHAGPIFPGTEYIFPLRKDLCLVVGPRNPTHDKNNLIFKADSEFVAKVNRLVTRAANLDIFSSQQTKEIDILVKQDIRQPGQKLIVS